MTTTLIDAVCQPRYFESWPDARDAAVAAAQATGWRHRVRRDWVAMKWAVHAKATTSTCPGRPDCESDDAMHIHVGAEPVPSVAWEWYWYRPAT